MSPLEKSEQVNFRVTPELRGAMEETARKAGLPLADWLRAIVVRAISEGAYALPKRRKKHERKS